MSRKTPGKPKLSTIRARALCRNQRRTNFGSMPCARRRMADDFVLWLHRGQLKKAVRIVNAVPSGDEETHDYLCHVVGISRIRVCDIGVANRTHGGIQSANELMATLNAAAQGLARARQRYEKMGCWGLDDPAIEPLREALDIYETVLGASSAMQMERAQTVRLAKLQAQMGVAA